MDWPYETGADIPALRASYETVVAHFQRPLAAYLCRIVRNDGTALELAQEVFVKAYQNLHRYDSARPFSSWLFGIAANHARDHLRRNAGADSAAVLLEGDAIEPSCRQPDRRIEAAELQAALDEAINALPLIYREPILLRHSGGLDVQQIADALSVSPAVVKTRLCRARQQLQQTLKKEWVEQ